MCEKHCLSSFTMVLCTVMNIAYSNDKADLLLYYI